MSGLQQELLKREDQFLRCLAEKLYTYALGRELGYADEPTIDERRPAHETELATRCGR